MPASSLDSVGGTLRETLGKNDHVNGHKQMINKSSANGTLSVSTISTASTSNGAFIQRNTYSSYKQVPYNGVRTTSNGTTPKSTVAVQSNKNPDSCLNLPTQQLYPKEKIKIGWPDKDIEFWHEGAGMVNMGNTCYINSTLQALFHVPSLVNWLKTEKDHVNQCPNSSFCIICAMHRTLFDWQSQTANCVRPNLIYNKLRLIGRSLVPGRQEDAHEFLKGLVESMEKSYLHRFKNWNLLDPRVKETTPLNHIFGGYLRSAVRCLNCGYTSTTFQHFQDLLLDIRKANTLEEALEIHFSKEKLDDDSYFCQSCQKKVPATKQFAIERGPPALCIQLKRFSVSNNKITRHIVFDTKLNLNKYARDNSPISLVYQLVAGISHNGVTAGSGHYTAIGLAPSGAYYHFDDSMVKEISYETLRNTTAYILLYELVPIKSVLNKTTFITSTVNESTAVQVNSTAGIKPALQQGSPSSSTSIKKTVSCGFTSDKVYGPELPPEILSSTSNVSNSKADSSSSRSPIIARASVGESSITSSGCDETMNNVSSSPSLSPKEADSTATGYLCDADQAPSSPTRSPTSTTVSTLSSPETYHIVLNSKRPRSLVPYETGDSTGSDDSNQSSSRKSTMGDFLVTSSSDVKLAKKLAKKEKKMERKVKRHQADDAATSSNGSAISKLLQSPTSGYNSAGSTWDGNRSNQGSAPEKRDDRKRSLVDSTEEHPRIKQIKFNSNYNDNSTKANGTGSTHFYNSIQKFPNRKNWKSMDIRGKFHRKPFFRRHQRVFHNKNGFYKNYRYR